MTYFFVYFKSSSHIIVQGCVLGDIVVLGRGMPEKVPIIESKIVQKLSKKASQYFQKSFTKIDCNYFKDFYIS